MYKNLILIAIAIILYLRNMGSALGEYGHYYKDKRRKFPWLDKWIKDNRIDPARTRANEAVFYSMIGFAASYLGISFIGGGIINFVIRFLSEAYLIQHRLIPNDFEHFLYMHLGTILSIIVAVIVGQKLWSGKLKDPEYENAEAGLSLECPSCHCPHSWVMLKRQSIVEKEWQEKKTTTTTTKKTVSADAYGGGFIGQMFASASSGSSTSTSTEITDYYSGKTHRDFKCLNCGKTSHHVCEETWVDKRPDESEDIFDPPPGAWSVGGKVYSWVLNLAVIAVLLFIAAGNIGRIAYDARRTKTEATQIHIGEADPSLNATLSKRRISVLVWAEPNNKSKEVTEIMKGDFFKTLGKSGDYTKIEYKGKQGYTYTEAVVSLDKGRTALVKKGAKLGDKPDKDAKTVTIAGGSKVTLLGENVNRFVKVEYRGEVYWIYDVDLVSW